MTAKPTKPRKMRKRKAVPLKKDPASIFDSERAMQLSEDIMRTSLDAELIRTGMVELLDKFSIRDTVMNSVSLGHHQTKSLYGLAAMKLSVVATSIRKYSNDLVDHCGNLEAQLQELIILVEGPKNT